MVAPSSCEAEYNPVFYDRSKIDVRYHFFQGFIEENRVTVESIGTVKQLADNLTKARRHERCSELRTKLGVIDVQNMRKA